TGGRPAVGALVLAALVAASSDRLVARAAPAQQEAPFKRVSLTAGRSTVVDVAFDVTRIAVTNPAVADAVVVQPREILIDGKASGTISLIVWGSGQRLQYDLVVEQG